MTQLHTLNLRKKSKPRIRRRFLHRQPVETPRRQLARVLRARPRHRWHREWHQLRKANTKANLVSGPSLVRAWRPWSLLELEYPHTLRNMESRVRANVPKNSVRHRRRLARPLVPKV